MFRSERHITRNITNVCGVDRVVVTDGTVGKHTDDTKRGWFMTNMTARGAGGSGLG